MVRNPANWTVDNMPSSEAAIKKRLTDPRCPVKILEAYLNHKWAKYIVQNPKCPPNLLERIAEIDEFQAYFIVEHKNVTRRAIDILASSKYRSVRSTVFRKYPELFAGRGIEGCSLGDLSTLQFPPDEIAKFYKRATRQERQYLLSNPNCPMPILQRAVSMSSNSTTLYRLAHNPALTGEMVARVCEKVLENDEMRLTKIILYDIIHHPNCPRHVLLSLLLHQNALVREDAFFVYQERYGSEEGK